LRELMPNVALHADGVVSRQAEVALRFVFS
jgi:hypothetical protein